MIVSANDVCRTRLCRAQDCELDAEPYSPWCWRCARKPDTKLHTLPPVYTGPTLKCSVCHAHKPDDHFSIQRAHKAQHRRYRNNECKACAATRRRGKHAKDLRRRNLTLEQRARKNLLARQKRAAAKSRP